MTRASRNLPRSCRWRWVSTSDMGRWRYSRTIRAMRNAIAVSAWLTMKSMPKMVENHLGSTDRIQSTAMKVTLNPQKRRPGPARPLVRRCPRCGGGAASCNGPETPKPHKNHKKEKGEGAAPGKEGALG